MFTVILITLLGVLAGFLLRRLRWLQHVNHTITLTICFMLFVLGLEVGENRLIVSNLAHFGGQALAISLAAVTGSALAGALLYRYAFGKGRKGGRS